MALSKINHVFDNIDKDGTRREKLLAEILEKKKKQNLKPLLDENSGKLENMIKDTDKPSMWDDYLGGLKKFLTPK